MDLPNTRGIYMLHNHVDGRIYIGQAKNIKERVREHFESLRRGDHKNSKLQAAFKVYGEDAFTAHVLNDDVSAENIDRYEQEWLDLIREFGKENIYNLCFVPNTTTGYRFTEEQRQKQSTFHKGRKQSEEWIRARIESSVATKKALGLYSEGHTKPKKEFTLKSPTGKIIHVKGLSDFATANKLNAGCLSTLANGKIKQYKGYTLVTED